MVLPAFNEESVIGPADVPRLVQALRDSGADIALGSRFLGQAPGIPMGRRMLLKGATLFTKLTTGLRLSDAHNGLRATTAEAARSVRIRQDGMAHASEIVPEEAPEFWQADGETRNAVLRAMLASGARYVVAEEVPGDPVRAEGWLPLDDTGYLLLALDSDQGNEPDGPPEAS